MTLADQVSAAVNAAPVVDLHTHLFAPQFGALNLWGIDELLTYHYLIPETLRADPSLTPEAFFARDKAAQADLVWEILFVRHTPLSEAASGVVTVLEVLGLDPCAPDLREARAFYKARSIEEHIEQVLDLAKVKALTMTNDPCDPLERDVWDSGVQPDQRFYAALRLDRLVHCQTNLTEELDRWIERMSPKYLALSVGELAPLPQAVLDACRAHKLPLALMIGVKRGVNPRLQSAGDGVITADLAPLLTLAGENPDLRFLVTTLSRENAHTLCIAARKFANILPFGCWWFMSQPSLVEETTLMRLELLGPTFVPQHSDARVLDQLIYKWRHARRAIASALTQRYSVLPDPPTNAQIERDAKDLMGGIASAWLG
ncbi:MAG TPA: hypothetical protein VGL56_01575 [Fimbriimonadaceae bacterium]